MNKLSDAQNSVYSGAIPIDHSNSLAGEMDGDIIGGFSRMRDSVRYLNNVHNV